jgi:hypothetical protein
MAATMVSSRTVSSRVEPDIELFPQAVGIARRVSCGEACFSLPAHQGRIGLALNHSLDKFAHPLAYPSFDRIEPVVEQINRCVGGGGPTATFSGISAVGREGEARWLATADGELRVCRRGVLRSPNCWWEGMGQGVDVQHDVGRAYRINSQT